jgi:condensin complex subunit 1
LRLDKQKDNAKGSKDGEELDQVAGNAEDDIGDVIANVRERELLYGPDSLLAMFGPMIVHICRTPKKFRVSSFPRF